jgi:ATP-dependent Lhr-like helicase
MVLESLSQGGALFFTEIVRRTRLLPSQVEQALSELAALGCVTADGFDGLRALLVPSDQRPTFGRNEGVRRRKTNLASIEFAGRWSLLRRNDVVGQASRLSLTSMPPVLSNESSRTQPHQASELLEEGDRRDAGPAHPAQVAEMRAAAMEKFARTLLHRYGVMFRRLLEREALAVAWYELGRIYRRWEARGEIRGGYFVGGVSGEQFALPEAIGLLRSIRKSSLKGELITLSAADPLNLQGLLTPGPRVAALTGNRILFRDGLPVAALEAGEIRRLSDGTVADVLVEKSLKVGKLPASLRPYYA